MHVERDTSRNFLSLQHTIIEIIQIMYLKKIQQKYVKLFLRTTGDGLHPIQENGIIKIKRIESGKEKITEKRMINKEPGVVA